MPILEASHSISNVLAKLGRAKMGALVNFSFKTSKASCCAGYGTKVGHKPFIKRSKAMKTLDIIHIGRGWPILNGYDLSLVYMNPFNTHNKPYEFYMIKCKHTFSKVSIQMFFPKGF